MPLSITPSCPPPCLPCPLPPKDPIARRSLLEQAAARLQHSASFALADPEPLIRLGDTLAAAAELAQQHQGSGFEFMAGVSGDAGQSIQVGSGPGAGAGPARSAAELLERALCEGYGAALALNRNNSEALVGGVGCECGRVWGWVVRKVWMANVLTDMVKAAVAVGQLLVIDV